MNNDSNGSSIKYNTLYSGDLLYRGDSNIYENYKNNELLRGNYKFFGLSIEEVQMYGVTCKSSN